jgi:hypothetical protein
MFRSKTPRRAAVLGCGPSGLFATHALKQNGWDVTVFSNKRKSDMFGAQYLHEPIPGLTDPSAYPIGIDYRLVGTADGYRKKIYGPNPIKVSVETLAGKHPAWDIRAAYDKAWDLYSGLIQQQTVTPGFLGVLQWSPDPDPIGPMPIQGWNFDTVVSTIPLDRICYSPDTHQFHSTSIWAIGDAPERGVSCPVRVDPATVICDGTDEHGWYRASNVYGYATAEWPEKSKPPLPGVASVMKPLYSTCTCYVGKGMGYRFVRLGRYGQWAKGVLSHHAYLQAAQL